MSDLTREDAALLDGHPELIVGELLAERRRQIAEKGYNPKHDEAHGFAELAMAAAAYAWSAAVEFGYRRFQFAATILWPWSLSGFKPKDPRRDLVRAGALVVAAIERLDRDALMHADQDAG